MRIGALRGMFSVLEEWLDIITQYQTTMTL